MWNKEEIGMLSLIAQILTTFLLKKREEDKNRQLMLQLNTILDTQDAYIYAITQDTYELLYLNQKTRKRDRSVKTGMACSLAFFGRNEACERCPLTGSGEIYNPKYGIWSKVQSRPCNGAAGTHTCSPALTSRNINGCSKRHHI